MRLPSGKKNLIVVAIGGVLMFGVANAETNRSRLLDATQAVKLDRSDVPAAANVDLTERISVAEVREMLAREREARGARGGPFDVTDFIRVDTGLLDGTDAGAIASDHSIRPVISGNGRYVAFTTFASNVIDGGTNGVPQVLRYDLDTDTVAGASVNNTGEWGNAGSGAPTFYSGTTYTWEYWRNGISNDGNLVSFTSEADNLVAGDTNGVSDVFVRNFTANTTIRVSTTGTGAQLSAPSWDGIISGDGSAVVFTSVAEFPGITPRAANDTVAVGTDALTGRTKSADIFVKTISSGAVTLVSNSALNVEANSDSYFATINNTGTRVVFASRATNLNGATAPAAPTATTGARSSVFQADFSGGNWVMTNLSVTETGTVPPAGANTLDDDFNVNMSRDGAHIVWHSRRDLVANIPADPSGNGNPNDDNRITHRVAATGFTSNRAVNVQNDGTTFVDPLSFRASAPAVLESGGNLYTAFYSLADPAFPTLNGRSHTLLKKSPVSGAATGPLVGLNVNPTVGPANTIVNYGDSFWNGASAPPSLAATSGGNIRVAFVSNSAQTDGNLTRGLNNVYVAEFDPTTDTVVSVRRLSVGRPQTPTATVGFPGAPNVGFSSSHNGRISPDGRYLATILTSPTNLGVRLGSHQVVLIDLADPTGPDGVEIVSFDATANFFLSTTFGFGSVANGYPSAGSAGAAADDGVHVPSRRWITNWGVSVSNNGRVGFYTLGDVDGSGPFDPTAVTSPVMPMYTNTLPGDDRLTFFVEGNPGSGPIGTPNGLPLQGPTGGDLIYLNMTTVMSANGQYFGYSSAAINVTPESDSFTSNNIYKGYITNTATRVNRLVTRARNTTTPTSNGVVPNGDSLLIAISNDGQKAVFWSSASNMLGGVNPAYAQRLFLWNDSADGVPNNGVGMTSVLSADAAGNLATNDPAGDFFAGFPTLAYGDNDLTKLVFEGIMNGGTTAFGPSNFPGGADGDQVYVKTISNNLNPSGHDLGEFRILSLKTDNSPLVEDPDPIIDEATNGVAIGGDGTFIAFSVDSDNMITTGDANGNFDVFLTPRPDNSSGIEMVSTNDSGDQTTLGSAWYPGIANTPNGSLIVKMYFDPDNIFNGGDSTHVPDLYLRRFLIATPASAGQWNMYE